VYIVPVNDGPGAVVVVDGVGPCGGACVTAAPVKGSPGPVVVTGTICVVRGG
jgi:hypothetical protein